MDEAAHQASSAALRVRLHITPFNDTLLDRFIAPSLKAHATNISFHTVETFPERGFGYVELPAAEAEKLKQKLNGTTLKGSKVRIEMAKPEKKRKSEVALQDEPSTRKVKKVKEKKDNGVLPGHELEEGRHVKRGWQDNAVKRGKGKKGDKAIEVPVKDRKMRFRTALSPNVAAAGSKVAKEKGKEKKSKLTKSSKKDVVVKEYSKSTTPSNTVAKTDRKDLIYEDGKGWVDADGAVVEEERPSTKRRRQQIPSDPPLQQKSRKSASKSLTDSAQAIEPTSAPPPVADDNASTSDSSSSASSILSQDSDASEDLTDQPPSAVDSAMQDAPLSAETEVHPLEALFKRRSDKLDSTSPATKLAPIDTSFNFFSGNSAEDDGDVDVDADADHSIAHPPQTPHTKQDMAWRSIRSAAPTPDTAAIGKRFNFPFQASDDEDEDAEQVETGKQAHEDREPSPRELRRRMRSGDGEQREESEFHKWFYENRGDLNRSWKKRRREEKKVLRQRENRRLGRKIA